MPDIKTAEKVGSSPVSGQATPESNKSWDLGQDFSAKRPTLYKTLGIFLTLAIFGLLAYLFYRDAKNLPTVSLQFQTVYLTLSAFLLLAGLLFEAWIWRKNLEVVGGRISLRESFKLYFQANITRYIPGKIWSVLGFVHLGQKAEVTASQSVSGLLIGLVSSLVSAAILGGLFLGLSGFEGGTFVVWVSGILVILGLVSLHPALTRFQLKVFSRLTRRPVQIPDYSFGQIIHLVCLYLFAWLVFSCSFTALVYSLQSLTTREVLFTLAIFPLAYSIGYLVVISPGGWGVREGGMALLLGQILPTYQAVSIAIVSRLMITAAEALLFALALRMKWTRHNPSSPT